MNEYYFVTTDSWIHCVCYELQRMAAKGSSNNTSRDQNGNVILWSLSSPFMISLQRKANSSQHSTDCPQKAKNLLGQKYRNAKGFRTIPNTCTVPVHFSVEDLLSDLYRISGQICTPPTLHSKLEPMATLPFLMVKPSQSFITSLPQGMAAPSPTW